MDVQVKKEIPTKQQTPLLDVLVSVIPEQTTPPTTTTEAQSDPSTTVLRRLQSWKTKLQSWHPKFLSKAVSEFVKPRLERTVHDMEKSRSYLDHDKHHDLYDALLNSISLDEQISRGYLDPNKVLKWKRSDDEDHDPPLDSTKEKKKKSREDVELSKKSSTSKESFKEVAMKAEESSFIDVLSDADQPQDDIDLKKYTSNEMPKVLSQAWDKFFEIQHAQPEDTHELLRKLLEDLQIIRCSDGKFQNLFEPFFDDEESISPKNDPHYFNAEFNLIESLLNRDTLIDSSPKFDYFLEEFFGKLAHIDPIPLGIEETDFDLEEEIRLVKNLLYDNSSLRPPEEINAEIADTILESLSPSPILVEDSDSQIKEIDLFLDTDDLMPPGIENEDYDSERDIYVFEELLNNDTPPLPENESSNFDHHDNPSFPRPSPEPPNVDILFDLEPDTGVLTAKIVEAISEHHVLMLKVLPTQSTLCLNIYPLL
uniref:Reverse transcriptase domain-containing protein n=1 Tax=Tanacetum cinerariifolium TaxID=118510 RepID=A0A6L2L6C1_TANCI|nr:hypothetical protein [Tanacetum cinerariifolium]